MASATCLLKLKVNAAQISMWLNVVQFLVTDEADLCHGIYA